MGIKALISGLSEVLVNTTEDDDSMRPSFCEFKANYDSQPEQWRKRLMAIYVVDQDAAIAAWTLIMSMDDLMLEVEETALFLNQIYSKK